jgi:hypothetical protein
MLILLITACMVSDPSQCKVFRTNIYDEDIPLDKCVSMSMVTELPKWQGENPNWRITKWTCGRIKVGPDGAPIEKGV